MTEQEKEIQTIRERTITLKLSDADVDRISIRAERHGLTVSQLLENFIGDLVGGTYSNGSDERDFADRWFDRCWFGMFPEYNFLTYVLDNWIDVDDVLDDYERLNDMKEDLEVEEDPEDIEYFESEIQELEDEFKRMFDDYLSGVREGEPDNLETGIKRLKEYRDRLTSFRGGDV